MSHQNAVIAYTGNGYGPKVPWSKTPEEFGDLCDVLVANHFNTVMADYRSFGADWQAYLSTLQAKGLRWLVDLSTLVQEDGYTYGAAVQAAVKMTLPEGPWGYQLWPQVSSPTNAAKIAAVAQGLKQSAPHLANIAVINHNHLGPECAGALAGAAVEGYPASQGVDVIGAWTTNEHFGYHHGDPVKVGEEWCQTLGQAASQHGHRFLFKFTSRWNEMSRDNFLQLVKGALVEQALNGDYRNSYSGVLWTHGDDSHFAHKGTLAEIKSINELILISVAD